MAIIFTELEQCTQYTRQTVQRGERLCASKLQVQMYSFHSVETFSVFIRVRLACYYVAFHCNIAAASVLCSIYCPFEHSFTRPTLLPSARRRSASLTPELFLVMGLSDA